MPVTIERTAKSLDAILGFAHQIDVNSKSHRILPPLNPDVDDRNRVERKEPNVPAQAVIVLCGRNKILECMDPIIGISYYSVRPARHLGTLAFGYESAMESKLKGIGYKRDSGGDSVTFPYFKKQDEATIIVCLSNGGYSFDISAHPSRYDGFSREAAIVLRDLGGVVLGREVKISARASTKQHKSNFAELARRVGQKYDANLQIAFRK